jgi:hypothetical protein
MGGAVDFWVVSVATVDVEGRHVESETHGAVDLHLDVSVVKGSPAGTRGLLRRDDLLDDVPAMIKRGHVCRAVHGVVARERAPRADVRPQDEERSAVGFASGPVAGTVTGQIQALIDAKQGKSEIRPKR